MAARTTSVFLPFIKVPRSHYSLNHCLEIAFKASKGPKRSFSLAKETLKTCLFLPTYEPKLTPEIDKSRFPLHFRGFFRRFGRYFSSSSGSKWGSSRDIIVESMAAVKPWPLEDPETQGRDKRRGDETEKRSNDFSIET